MILKLIILIALVILTILFIFDDRKKLFPKLGMVLFVLIYIVIVFHATPSLKATNFLESIAYRGEVTDSDNIDNKYIIVRERESGDNNSIRFYTYGKLLGLYYKDRRNAKLSVTGAFDINIVRLEINDKIVLYTDNSNGKDIVIKIGTTETKLNDKDLLIISKEDFEISELSIGGEVVSWSANGQTVDAEVVSYSFFWN